MTRWAWLIWGICWASGVLTAQDWPEDSVVFWSSPVVDTLHWGPEPGSVHWSLKDHGLRWSTPRLNLVLDPWITFRHVSGTTNSEATPMWDNLRGAHFRAKLDDVWEVCGSLEELQGVPGVWDAVAMTSTTALPGWGRAKVLSDGRGDVARARVTSTKTQGLGDQDTLIWTAAYAPFHWGSMPSALAFSSTAASFPRGGLAWKHKKNLEMGLHAGRWTGTERSELGGSTESLFRQSDVSWGHALWTTPKITAGLLTGMARRRPWIGELETDTLSQFEWSPLVSFTTKVPLGGQGWWWTGEVASHQGAGSAITFEGNHAFQGAVSVTRLFASDATSDALGIWSNAGTPLSATIRPTGVSGAAWRTEVHGHWHKGDVHIGGRAAKVGSLSLAEAWVGWTLQSTWPLHVTAGVELWKGGRSTLLPEEGARFRVGLAHHWGMTPGSPTFGAP